MSGDGAPSSAAAASVAHVNPPAAEEATRSSNEATPAPAGEGEEARGTPLLSGTGTADLAAALSALPEPSQGGRWVTMPRAQLLALITAQVPAYTMRPYLADEEGVRRQLADGLAYTLVDDFCWSLNFRPRFVARLCFEGFLPICSEIAGGTGLYVLLPKLHTRRCVLEFEKLHVAKSTRKRSRAFTVSINRALDQVIEGCIEQHGQDWLHPPMRAIFTALFECHRARTTASRRSGAHDSDLGTSQHRGNGRQGAQHSPPGGRGNVNGGAQGEDPLTGWSAPSTRMASFELWDREGRLVAGELGCINGCCYTSFSGFHRVANSGSVQLALTARLLERAGFRFWDLGQEFEYKTKLGASLWPRLRFLERFRAVRHLPSRIHEVEQDLDLLANPAELLQVPRPTAEQVPRLTAEPDAEVAGRDAAMDDDPRAMGPQQRERSGWPQDLGAPTQKRDTSYSS
mmetsp:Transcript_24166/g.65433  ORF Transcript_24166/g.65433 Transcript_24166/m.65433 type:complete len:458 (-) Transcript_24166:204-1577(-)|eukprot:CAMPEP_0185163874 /NCGR_PEP_ID=MMETSP1139-20130426/8617_1 /TAXON_ID=298111 /ORGANISM="Pavlova sp., Strain CCMP459" /LENGTH=457 /DNA_ID=CAMNT_0027729239 /DNA_START=41 /DNA_END=1414 /DNA_ORIENTATION=-